MIEKVAPLWKQLDQTQKDAVLSTLASASVDVTAFYIKNVVFYHHLCDTPAAKFLQDEDIYEEERREVEVVRATHCDAMAFNLKDPQNLAELAERWDFSVFKRNYLDSHRP